MAELFNVSRKHVKVWRYKFKPIHFLLFLLLSLYVAAVIAVYLEGNTLEDSLYWNACSLSWSNCHVEIEYTPLVKVLSLVHGMMTLAVIAVVGWMVTEQFINLDLEGIKMKNTVARLKDHFIVCGYGRVGEHVCDVLDQNKVPFVVIEDKKELADHVKERGMLGIDGDALKPDVLEKAGIGRAKGVIAAMGSDSDNLFLVLTARELNPNLKIVASRAHSKAVVTKLHKVGADVVVLPEIVGGLELAREVLNLGGKSHADKMVSRGKSKF